MGKLVKQLVFKENGCKSPSEPYWVQFVPQPKQKFASKPQMWCCFNHSMKVLTSCF